MIPFTENTPWYTVYHCVLYELWVLMRVLLPSSSFSSSSSFSVPRYAKRPALAKVLCDYILYHEHNPKKALELASEATVQSDYRDWWWKARLGKCYYQLGLYRDAEKQVCYQRG